MKFRLYTYLHAEVKQTHLMNLNTKLKDELPEERTLQGSFI